MAGIREVYELVDRATAPLRNIETAMTGVTEQAGQMGTAGTIALEEITRGVNAIAGNTSALSAMSGTMQGIQATLAGMAQSFNAAFSQQIAVGNMQSEVERLNQSLQAQKTHTAELLKQMQAMSGSGRGTADAFKQLTAQIEQSRSAEKEYEQSLNALQQSLRGAKSGTDEFAASTRRAADEMSGASSKAGFLQSTLGKMAAAFGGMALVKKVMDLTDELTMTQARLNNVNDGLQTTAELQDMIYQAAQRSRGSYAGMMQTVASLKAQTGDTFSSVREAIAFTELLNKQFKIAGADATAIASTMYNLTQALSTGVLRGQDLNIVMSNAPQIAQRIAKAMGVSVGELKNLASQGQVTSDVVKRAMLDSADDINKQFEEMPKTFGDVGQEIKNIATKEFEPISKMMSDAVNSGEVEQGISAIGNAFYIIAGIAGRFFGAVGEGLGNLTNGLINASGHVGFLGTAFIVVSGIVSGVSAYILNRLAEIANMGISSAEFLYNAWAQAVFAVQSAVIKFASGAVRAFAGVVRSAGQAASAIGNAFVQGVNIAIGGINKLIDAINKIPGVNIGGVASLAAPGNVGADLAASLDGVADALGAMQPDSPTLKMFERAEVQDPVKAFKGGYASGSKWAENLLNGMNYQADAGDYGDVLSGIEQNTANAVPNGSGGSVGSVGKVKKVEDVKLSDEDLKIYRDLAERRYMNNIELKTLAPEITVNLPAGASGNLSAQDVADKLKRMLIAEMAAQTSVAHA